MFGASTLAFPLESDQKGDFNKSDATILFFTDGKQKISAANLDRS
jgi:hypothetical protein